MKTKSTRSIAFRKKEYVDISLRSPTIQEALPSSFVHYPNHYGTFISFSESADSPHHFCSCALGAVQNALRLLGCMEENDTLKYRWGMQHHFSNYYCEAIQANHKFADVFFFTDKLCHRCNLSTPGIRWCHEMYGGNFKQYYGWYIKQFSLRMGFDGKKYLKERCPAEIQSQLSSIGHISPITLDPSDEEYIRYYALLKSQERSMENQTRQEFGFRDIGDSWINETLMHQTIASLLPDQPIIRHFRPDWLGGLELDVYLPELNISFEYQGQQHFFPIKAWGGKRAFEKLMQRDELKTTNLSEVRRKTHQDCLQRSFD